MNILSLLLLRSKIYLPEIIELIEFFGRCMTNNFSIGWLFYHRIRPKCFSHRLESQFNKESLGKVKHFTGRVILKTQMEGKRNSYIL